MLDHIKSELRRKGYPPSVREIGEAIGLSSSSTVHGHLARLEEKGYIRRDRTKPRAIEILEADGQTTILQPLVNVPVLGRVTAGQPILAVQNVEEYFPVPLDFTRDEDVFFLQIRGDSMIEAGILNGDYVLVHQQTTADNGDIVVAMIEDEATVKRFFREANHIRLQPENSLMEPLIVQHCAILGKVTGLIRRIN